MIGFFEESVLEPFTLQAVAELNVPVRYLREHKALGTGGGIHHYRDEVLKGAPEYLFVLHSDVYGDFRLEKILADHVAKRDPRAITVLGKKVRIIMMVRADVGRKGSF